MSKAPKPVRRHVSGVFLLNKPLGMSSNAALQKVRWLFRAHKAGHTGALDPLATGLLPICLGEATKFSHYLLDAPKRYITTVKLGQKTTTGDAEGEVVMQRNVPELNADCIEAVLVNFRGAQQQIPPMYSALKRDGKTLYDLARQGIEIEREARPIYIYELQLLSFNADSICLEIHCSKGTYIRVLGEDIGEALGCGGHLSALHRTQTEPFQLIPEYSIEYLETLSEAERDALLLPVDASVAYLPKIQIPLGRSVNFMHGQESNIEHDAMPEVLVFDGERCLGLAEINDKKRLIPKRILNL